MKLPFSWRRRPATETKETGPVTPALAEPPIDITIRRECHLRSFKGDPGPCPRCGGPLRQSPQTYMIVTRRGRRATDSFIMGSDFGWFCANCPTVVINGDEVSKMLGYSRLDWDAGEEFAVAGIIDLDAIPENKRHLPLGEDDNPIPLVEFTYPSERPPSERPMPAKERAAVEGGPRDDEHIRLALKKRAEAKRKDKARRKQAKALRRRQRRK